jgi:hypothetical protein
LHRTRLEAGSLEQGAKRLKRLLEARAAFVERDADCFVVGGRRAGADAGDEAAVGQDIERGERLRERYRAADHRQADAGREARSADSSMTAASEIGPSSQGRAK